MHDKIRARYVIGCIIETREPLHIGSGESAEFVSGVDCPVVKMRRAGSEIPVVPGSSIKGVLRAHFSRIFNSIPVEKYGFRKMEGDMEEFEREFSKGDEEGKMEMLQSLGTLEKFFGISGLAAPIRITDAEPEPNTEVRSRTHVKINVGTDRAEKGGLFTVEFAEGTFRFKIVFDELDSEYYEDVNKFFHEVFARSLKRGLELHIGGMKSRGYGLCVLKMERGWKFTPEKLAFGEAPEKWGEDL
jgi:CRISPR/Cas system CSM-associated protein Csm3 (group 7 of RAMP superfamily)